MRRIVLAALLGGLVGGAIDLAYALIVSGANGTPPQRLLQIIAAGLVGRDAAFAGGLGTAALGAALHFGIVIVMAAVFCAVSLALPILRRYPVPIGIAYGVLLYAAMNYVVVPNSALGDVFKPPTGLRLWGELASHMFGVGLPIAMFARWIVGRA